MSLNISENLTEKQILCKDHNWIESNKYKNFLICTKCEVYKKTPPQKEKEIDMLIKKFNSDNITYRWIKNPEYKEDFSLYGMNHPLDLEFIEGKYSIDDLVEIWKYELIKLRKDFHFNEQEEVFKPLRKYFNTASKIFWEKYNPMIDEDEGSQNYRKLTTVMSSAGNHYFFQHLYEYYKNELINKFIIDSKHPHLYNSTDDNNSFYWRDAGGIFGKHYILDGYYSKEESISKERYKTENKWIKESIGNKFDDLISKKNWMYETFARTFWIYGWFQKKEDNRLNSSIDISLFDFMDDTNRLSQFYNEKDLKKEE